MNELVYAFTPFLTWLVSGAIKFLINSFRVRRFAFDLIGYGGLPSNHSAIVASMTTLICLKEGMQNPAFGVAITLAFIVILDAGSLRIQVGKHAIAINKINNSQDNSPLFFRERIGHTWVEILAGLLVGCVIGYFIWYFL